MKTSLRFLLNVSVIMCLFAWMVISCTGNHLLMVSNLRCEYLENPLGMDKIQPRFSWYISSNQRGTIQSAYRIIVVDTPEAISKGNGNIWDSGKISSDQSTNLEYKGSPLQSDKTYYWNVIVWDQKGEQSSETKAALFHTPCYLFIRLFLEYDATQ